MKILHINCNYITTALHQTMIEHLEKAGIQNHVFVPVYDKNHTVISVNDNVTVRECFNKWDRVDYFYKQKKILAGVQSACNVNEFECIHAYTLFTDGNCAMELSRKYSIPYVVAIRNTDVNTFFKYMVHLRKRGIEIMQNASAIFFLSAAYKKRVFDKYVPKYLQESLMKKSYIVPNGIDDFWESNAAPGMDEARIKRIKDRHLKIIYAGRIDKNKNILTTQKAVKYLRKNGYEVDFTVVGKVADASEFKKIISDPGTTYIEAQPKEKLIHLYRAHDIFVMPSYTETFGLVYAEAMSQGLPVIYTRGEGFDGCFPEGEVGFPVSAKDAEEIAESCMKCVENYSEISSNCIYRMVQFDWDNICQTYKKIYRHILE